MKPEKVCGTCKHRASRSTDFGMGVMAYYCDAEERKGVGVQKHSHCINGKWERK